MYLFCHIEKCGGTSAHDYLSKKINNYLVLKPHPSHGETFNSDQLKMLAKIYPKIRGLGGHRLRFNENYCKDFKLFTIFRDPCKRYMSHMNHHLERGIANHKDEFLQNEYFDNFICKKISGNPSFNEAKKIIIKKDIKVFFLESEKILGLRNVSKNKVNDHDVLENEIINKNDEDIKLYKWALSYFNENLDDYFKSNATNKITNLETFMLQNIVQRFVHFFCNRNAKKLKRGF